MANSVDDEIVRFDSALKEALKSLSEFNVSCIKIGTKRNNCYTGSGKDLLAVLPNGFGKSLMLQVLVPMKEVMTGKPASVVVVFPLQRIVYDQME